MPTNIADAPSKWLGVGQGWPTLGHGLSSGWSAPAGNSTQPETGVATVALPDLVDGTPLRVCAERVADAEHLTYLLGAGASTAAGLPSWSELLRSLLVSRKLSPTAISALLAGQDTLLASEAAFGSKTRPAGRQKQIFKALYGTTDTVVAGKSFTPTPMHVAVAESATARGPDRATLMTLNYDDLLEEALAAEILSLDTSLSVKDATGKIFGRGAASPRHRGKYEVHHLHGLLPRSSLVADGDPLTLTLSDYNRLIDDAAAWQFDELFTSLQCGPLVMVGTSFSDPDIRVWLGRLKDKSVGEVVALIPRQGLGLRKADLALVQQTLEQQWRNVGVTCQVLDDYAEVTQVIRELSYVRDGRYVPPRQRVAGVLAKRRRKFTSHQRDDSARLENQMDAHLSSLHDSTINLTLWLHDGVDALVRWSAADRVYKPGSELRHVPAILESPWVAAEAICGGVPRARQIHSAGSSSGPGTGRWASVLAVPVEARLRGGPLVPVGAVSSALTGPMEEIEQVAWLRSMESIAQEWSNVLSQTEEMPMEGT